MVNAVFEAQKKVSPLTELKKLSEYVFRDYKREATKKQSSSTNGQAIKAFTPSPPSRLMALGTFFLNSRKRILTFFSPHNIWTKIALFFRKYCNNQVKIPTDKL